MRKKFSQKFVLRAGIFFALFLFFGIARVSLGAALTDIHFIGSQNQISSDNSNQFNIVTTSTTGGAIRISPRSLPSALFIDVNGNIGVGTTTPATALHIIGSSTVSGNLSVGGSILGTFTGTNSGATLASSVRGNGSVFGSSYDAAGTNYRFNDGANNPLLFIDAANGRVGIGTAAPTAPLQISASSRNGIIASFSTSTQAAADTVFALNTVYATPAFAVDAVGRLTKNCGATGCAQTENSGGAIPTSFVHGVNTNNGTWTFSETNSGSAFFRANGGTGNGRFDLLAANNYISGNVGIGTTTPSGLLDVYGGVNSTSRFARSVASVAPILKIQGDAVLGATWEPAQLQIAGLTNSAYRLQIGYDTTVNAAMMQAIEAAVAYKPIIFNPLGGSVGVGTTAPLAKLSVGNGTIADVNVPIQMSASGTMAYIGVNRTNGAYGALFGWDSAFSGGSTVVRSVNAADSLNLVVNNGIAALTITPAAGNVGVSTTTPVSARLVINPGAQPSIDAGSQRIINLAVPTGANDAVNKTYVDSAIAVATSTTSQWNTNGSNIYNSNSGNVGVGTSTPNSYKLQVVGSFGSDSGNLYTDGLGNLSATSFIDKASPTYFLQPSGATSLKTFGSVNIGGGGAPVAMLEVKGPITSGSASLLLKNGDTSTPQWNGAQIQFGYSNSGNYPSFIATRHNAGSVTNNAIDFYTGDGTAAGVFPTNAVLGLSINGGKVGIGVTNPGSKLSLGTTIGSDSIRIYDGGGASNFGWGVLNNELQSFITSGAHFSFNAGGTLQSSGTNEVMRIMGTGNVGIGTTTPATALSVVGSSTISGNLAVGGSITGTFTGTNSGATLASSVRGNGGVFGSSYDAAGTNYQFNDATNTALLKVDATNGRIGVGTGAPVGKLHVQGNNVNTDIIVDPLSSGGGDASLRLVRNGVGFEELRLIAAAGGASGGNNMYLLDLFGNPNARDLQIRSTTNGGASYNNLVKFTTTGNVGIGTTNPLYRLNIQGTGATSSMIAFNNSGNPVPYVGIGYNQTADGLAFMYNQGSTDLNGTGMFMDRLGNVGIGTTAPAQKLQVNGTGSLLGFYNNTSFRSAIGDVANYNQYMTGTTPGDFALLTAGTKIALGTVGGNIAMSILTSNGNVGIGTTTPSNALSVAGNANFGTNNWLLLQDTGGGNGRLVFSSIGSIDGDNFYFRNKAGTTYYAGFANNGNLGVGTSTYPSTARLVLSPGAQPSIDAGSQRIINVATPTGVNDAVNKTYVDSAIAVATSATSQWTTNGSNIYNSNSGNVGVGTSTPTAYKLQVAGSFGSDSGNLYTDGLGNISAASFVDKASPTYFLQPSGATSLKTAGKVMIGSAGTPNAPLTIANNVYTAPLGSAYNQYQVLLYDAGNASTSYGIGIEGGYIGLNSNGGYKFYQTGSTTPIMTIGGVAGNTNVGIGTATPASKLSLEDSTLSQIQLHHTGGPTLYVNTNQGNGRAGINSNLELDIQPAGTTYLARQSGNVGVGTTTPAEKLSVAGNIGFGASPMFKSADGEFVFTNSAAGTQSGKQINTLVRTIPTVIDSTVDIGTFGTTYTHSIHVTISVNDSGFSVAKTYLITSEYGQTGGAWAIIPPISDGGAYSGNDFQLEGAQSGATFSLRIRRTAGATVGTARITMDYDGDATTSFTASTATSSSVPVATMPYPTTVITQKGSNVGLATLAPSTARLVITPGAQPSIDAGSQRIINVATPTGANDATNKTYVDSAIAAATSSNTWTVNGTHIYNSNSGNVGVGTSTAPTYKLQVTGSFGSDSGNLYTDGLGNISAASFVDKASPAYYLQPSGATSLKTFGNVVIGAAGTPSTRLQVGAKVNDDNTFTYDANAIYAVHQTPTSATTLNDPKNILLLARQGTGGQAFGAAAAFNISRYENVGVNSRTRLDISLAHNYFDATTNNVMTLLSSGNIGIGTVAPAAKVEVVTASDTSGQPTVFDNKYFTVGTGGATGGSVFISYDQTNNRGYIGALTPGVVWRNLILQPGGGNVGINTATPGGNLSIVGSAGTEVGEHINNTNAGGYSALRLGSDAIAAAGSAFHYFNPSYAGSGAYASSSLNISSYGAGGLSIAAQAGPLTFFTAGSAAGNERMRIDANGNVGIGTTAPGVYGTQSSLDVHSAGHTTLAVSSAGGVVARLALSANSKSWLIDSRGSYDAPNNRLSFLEPTAFAEVFSMLPTSGNMGLSTTTPNSARLVIVPGSQPSIDAGSQRIINLATPTGGNDAVNKTYVDSALAAATSTTSQWVSSSTDIYNNNSGKVMVGFNSSPTYKLDVHGTFGADTNNIFTDGLGNLSATSFIDKTSPTYYLQPSAATSLKTAGSVAISMAGTPSTALDVQGVITTRSAVGDVPASATEGLRMAYTSSGADTSIYRNSIFNEVSATANTGLMQFRVNNGISSQATVMSLLGSGSVGIGTSTPGANLLYVNGATLINGTLNLNNNNISSVNKLSVAALDPLYEIEGANYSTYAASIAGSMREEYVGRGKMAAGNKQQITNNREADYVFVLDFSKIEKGGDLWVWRKAVDFSADNIEVFATAIGEPVPIAYEIGDNMITFRATNSTNFSYRLVGKRFDWRNWPTYAKDQNEKALLIVK